MFNAYTYVGDEVRSFWKENGICNCVVLLTLNDYPLEVLAFCESDSNPNDVTFDFDFWEGEKDIVVQNIARLWEVLHDFRKKWEVENEKDYH